MRTQQLPPSSKQNKKIRRYLVARHGETNYNKERRVQGTSDKSILTLDGISQASALGVYLYCRQAGEVLDNNDGADNNASVGEEVAPPITRTWCSPLTRCKQTYAAISGCCSSYSATNTQHHPLPDPTIHDNLCEIKLCQWQDRLRQEIVTQDSANWKIFKETPKNLTLKDSDGKDFLPVVDCWERGIKNWKTIRSNVAKTDLDCDEEDFCIFIMCHGAIGQCMLLQALGISIDHYGKSRRYSFDNCECVEIEWVDDDCVTDNDNGKLSTSVRWRRVHPNGGSEWQSTVSSQKMGSELSCSR